MNLFKKIFCGHQWKIHRQTKERRKLLYTDGRTSEQDYYRDILVCEICGKIKIIEY